MAKKKMARVTSDPWLLLIVALLCLGGALIVYSTTHNTALTKFGDPYFFLRKHLFSLFLGWVALLLIAYVISLDYLRKATFWILFGTMGMLVLLHIPGFGVEANGALRWLKIGNFRIGQPSEFAKLALALYLAHSLERKYKELHKFTVGFVPHVLIAGVFVILLMAQPDFGTSMMLLAMTGVILFVSGVPIVYLVGSVLLALPAIYLMLIRSTYRWKRITSFLRPFDPELKRDGGYQLVQSIKAFVEGGLMGRGLGSGQQKLGALPEAHTDFIFAIWGEELGLLGVVIFILLILALIYRGFLIASRSHTLFGRYLAFGLTSLIALQCIINLGVVMGSFPTKGMPLPFLSFARSSLIVILASIGILLRIEHSRQKHIASLNNSS